jgi:REP element-mobilizing transposase RayT
MIAGYHLIWTIYGSWLPNDPRGSSSHEIRASPLEELGEIHFGRKKVQPCSKIIRKFYQEAKPKLKHEIMVFSDDEIALLAEAFAATITNRRYTCYGCAIMPDHVHILIRKHRDQAEEMIALLQDDSWQRLIDEKRRPSDHPVWGGPGWKVYLNSCEDIERTVRYIRDNPIKAGKAPQQWDFVHAYDGWLPGVGAKKK